MDSVELARIAVKEAASVHDLLKKSCNAFDLVTGTQLATDDDLVTIATELSASNLTDLLDDFDKAMAQEMADA